MAGDLAFDQARKAIAEHGGCVSVILGRGQDVPSDFVNHPRVHWLIGNNINHREIRTAIPSDTRLVAYTPDIDPQVYRAVQRERERRRLPSFARRTPSAILAELSDVLPKMVRVPRLGAPPPLPIVDDRTNETEPDETAAVDEPEVLAIVGAETETAAAATAAAAATTTTTTTPAEEMPMPQPKPGHGSVNEFVKKHADLSPASSNAEEARRLLPLMKQAGITSTLGSISVAIGNLKRKGGRGSRPMSGSKRRASS